MNVATAWDGSVYVACSWTTTDGVRSRTIQHFTPSGVFLDSIETGPPDYSQGVPWAVDVDERAISTSRLATRPAPKAWECTTPPGRS